MKKNFTYNLDLEANEHQKLIQAHKNARKIPRQVRVAARMDFGITVIGWFYEKEPGFWAILSPNAETGVVISASEYAIVDLKGKVPAACVKPDRRIAELQEFTFVSPMYNSRYMPIILRSLANERKTLVRRVGAFVRASNDTSGWMLFSPSNRNWVFITDEEHKKHAKTLKPSFQELIRIEPNDLYVDYQEKMCSNCYHYARDSYLCYLPRTKEQGETKGGLRTRTTHKCDAWIQRTDSEDDKTYTRRKIK